MYHALPPLYDLYALSLYIINHIYASCSLSHRTPPSTPAQPTHRKTRIQSQPHVSGHLALRCGGSSSPHTVGIAQTSFLPQ